MSGLQKLLESSILTDETKTVLTEAWATAQSVNRAEIETEYATKLAAIRTELVAESIQMVDEALADELVGIAEELADARSLEVVYAQKLQDFKESYAEKTSEMVNTQVAESVKHELDEMREDIEFAKKNQFVMGMFESYRDAFANMFGESDVNIHQELEEAKVELNSLRREKVLNELLESVTGDKRGVVMTILDSVETSKLADKFETLRPIIMKESAPVTAEPIVEGAANEPDNSKTIMESGTTPKVEPTSTIDPAIAAQIQRSLRSFK